MNSEELLYVWKKFVEKSDFKLNPDTEIVELILEGVLENEKNHGLKLCPCRLRDGTRERDLELLCPCNFQTHEIWSEKDRCWCGLFIKK